MIKVGVNGFGRIGQAVVRIWAESKDPNFEIVVINGIDSAEVAARDMAYDSVYGRYGGTSDFREGVLILDGREIKITNIRKPEELEWGKHGVDLVIDSSGFYKNRELVQKHLDAGAKRVLITAPTKGDDITIVLGVNEDKYDPEKHFMVSNASCTTNCLAPIAKVVDENFGIIKGSMTTVHAYTNDQVLVDYKHKDPRRARAAALNIIPTSTGAATALGLVLPQLKGKMNGISLRVPTPTVSIVDMVVLVEKSTTVEEVNAVLKAASEQPNFKGILGYTEEPLVSMDYKADTRSSIVDALSTDVIDGNLVKVLSWYDNEWGYSTRVIDLATLMIEKGI